jgi:hypothetical protein
MAELVGAYAASHGPLLVRAWDAIPAEQRVRLSAAYAELGRRISSTKTDVLVVVAPDHWSNFFLDNLPSVCIGVGAENDGPPEGWMKAFPHRTIPGHADFAAHLSKASLDAGFEPSVSHRLKLDHGFCIPLWKMGLDPLPRIVPIVVNSIEPPFPSVKRCLEWGGMIRKAVSTFRKPLKVAVLATGGLSHSIGEKTMGAIDEKLDRQVIKLFSSPKNSLLKFLESKLPKAGNGTAEVRNWLVAHGAAGGRGFEIIDYLPVPTVYVGCGYAAWRTVK